MKNSHVNNSALTGNSANGNVRGEIAVLIHGKGRLLKKQITLARIAEMLGAKFDGFMQAMQGNGARVHYYSRYHSLAVITRNQFTRFDW